LLASTILAFSQTDICGSHTYQCVGALWHFAEVLKRGPSKDIVTSLSASNQKAHPKQLSAHASLVAHCLLHQAFL
jgi:hypothetical protein